MVAVVPERLARMHLRPDGPLVMVEPPFDEVVLAEGYWYASDRLSDPAHRWLFDRLDELLPSWLPRRGADAPSPGRPHARAEGARRRVGLRARRGRRRPAGALVDRPLVGSRSMPVPASYNDIVPSPTFRDHVGDAWYQRTVHVPAGWDGRRIVLRVDAATHRGTVCRRRRRGRLARGRLHAVRGRRDRAGDARQPCG
jgi:hypothetical protein